MITHHRGHLSTSVLATFLPNAFAPLVLVWLLSLLIGTATVNAQTLTWTGAGDGVTFGSAANWSPAVVPGATNDCVIPSGPETIVPSSNVAIRSLITGRNINLGVCIRLTVTAGITLTDGVKVTINNQSTCSSLVFDGGTQSISGDGEVLVVNTAGNASILLLQNNVNLSIGAGIAVKFNPTAAQRRGLITVSDGCSLTNFGTLSVAHATGTLNITGPGSFTNLGSLKCTLGTLIAGNLVGDLGQLTISPNATASITGLFAVSQPLSVPAGANLTLAGNWTSAVPITAISATLSYSGAWSSTGLTTLTESTWNLTGTYAAFGPLSRTGGTINVGGNFTGPELTASSTTGNLVLNALTLSGTLIRALDGATMRMHAISNFNACTLDAEISIECMSLRVTGGLTLAENGKISIVRGCSNAALTFVGGMQSVSGTGSIVILGTGFGADPLIQFSDNSTVTFAAGISLVFGNGLANAGGFMSIDAGCAFVNNAPITVNTYAALTLNGAGSFENHGAISAAASSSLTVKPAAWFSTAAITGTDATLVFEGSYASIGSISRNGGSLTLGGIFLGTDLEASEASGDLVLSNFAASGTVFNAVPGRKILVKSTVTLNACTLASNFAFQGCAEIVVTGGLALAGGVTLTVGDSYSCSPYSGLTFLGGVQQVSGSGTIVLWRGASADAPAMRLKNNVSLSISPGISIVAANLTQHSYITIDAGCTLTNFGTILASEGMVITGSGTFINQSLVEASDALFSLSTASWTNGGTFRVSANGRLYLGGSYSSLGQIDRISGKIDLEGNFTGTLLEATAASGSLSIGSMKLTNTTLSASGGASFTVVGFPTLDGCSIAAPVTVLPCATIYIRNGLTLASGTSILIDYSTGSLMNCGGPALLFIGTQSLQGIGEVVVNDTLDKNAIRVTENSTVTFSTGITFRFGPGSTGFRETSFIYLDAGSTLINEGTIAVRQANKVLTIRGATTANLVNTGKLESIAGTLAIESVSWSNAGTLAVSGSGTLNLGGKYSAFGTIVRSGGTIALLGDYLGTSLTANASTGDLALANVTLQNCSLSLTPGYQITSPGSVTLNSCKIITDFTFGRCATLSITGDLVVENGSIVTFNGPGTCGTYNARINFGAGVQQIRGSGELHLNGATIAATSTLTIAPGIIISGGPEVANRSCRFTGPITNQGSIIADSGNFLIENTFINQGSVAALSSTLEIRALTGSAGLLTVGPAASLILGGNFSLDQPIDISPGRSLALSGTWTNNTVVTVTSATLSLLGTWVNNGSFIVNNTLLTLGGNYTSLGNFTSTGNQLTYTGTVPATTLTANSSTGDITLKAATLNNVLLQASDGAKFRVIGSSSSKFNGCTVAADIVIVDCSTATISNGLTFVNGAEIQIRNLSEGCSSYAIELLGSPQTITGNGAIRMLASPTGAAIAVFSQATLDTGVSFVIDPQSTASYVAISILQSMSLTNKGVLSADPLGSQLAIIGGGPFLNQGLLRVSAWSTLSIGNLSGPLGAISLDPAATLILAGTYSISDPLAISGGGGLNLSGTWTNNSTISVDHSTLFLAGTWTNAGTLAVSNSSWTIGGTYTALGNTTGSSNALTYAGTFPGPVLEANATTGDITLSTLTLNNTTLRTRDNARINVGLGSAVTMSQCSIETDLRFTYCSTLSINKGLTLADGITLTFDNPFCNRPALTFTGTTQSVTGRAKLAILDAGSANAITLSTSTNSVVTLGSDLELAFGPTPAGSVAPLSNFTISVGTGRTLLNEGLIASRLAGKTLTIATGTFQNSGTVESAAGSVNITSTLSNYATTGARLTGGRWIMSGGSLAFGTSVINSIGPGTEFRIQSASGTSPSFASFGENLGTFAIASRTLSTTPGGGTFSNAGTLELGPAANMQINGSLAFDPASTLRIPISGLAQPALGQLTATGPITLAGKLAAAFTPPFTPQSGDTTATILSSPSLLVAFASTCADGNPASLGVQPVFDSVSAPNTLALLVTASGGLTPFITQQPVDTNATPNANFSCAASPADATFRWFKDGVALVDGPTGHGSIISGAFSSSLSIAGTTASDSGLYTCSATNSCGTTLSNSARLSVCPGDFNADGLVDDSDFQLFVASYNLLDCADPAMPPACPADLDRSGAVDDGDFPIFIISYDALLCP